MLITPYMKADSYCYTAAATINITPAVSFMDFDLGAISEGVNLTVSSGIYTGIPGYRYLLLLTVAQNATWTAATETLKIYVSDTSNGVLNGTSSNNGIGYAIVASAHNNVVTYSKIFTCPANGQFKLRGASSIAGNTSFFPGQIMSLK